jgi:hypothetical protein
MTAGCSSAGARCRISRSSTAQGEPPPSGLSEDELRAYEQLSNFYAKHLGYAQITSTRPQTLYGFADSPIDWAAFALDHGDGTGQPGLVAQVLDGTLDSDLTRDDLLDNLTLYWLTNTGVSAARLYWENKRDFFDAKPITIPFAISVFPDKLYQAPRSWAERAYPNNLIHYNRLDRGGHFAAWEQPQLFAEEMRAGVQIAAQIARWISARTPISQQRQTGRRPLHGLRPVRAGGRLPDDVVHGVRLEERSEIDSRIAVGSDQLLDKRLVVSARAGARNESGEVPRDRADAHVLEVVPDEAAVGVQQIRNRDVSVKRLSGQ